MGNLKKYTLSHDKKHDQWDLKRDKSDTIKKTFDTKEKATQGGVLKKALGSDGGSVKIKKLDGTIQEERTYPKKKDPTQSPG